MQSTIQFQRDGFPLFARVLGPERAPALLYLQGGPGMPGPRERHGWIDAALARGYRVVLLDQRGTGRSTRIDAATPSLIDASVLARLRQEDIVADAEALRDKLGLAQWDVLGQSFGGFCLAHYLARHPERVGHAFFTGGLPAVGASADEVYTATFAKLRARHDAFTAAYPHAQDAVREVCRHVETHTELLPTGERLTARRLRTVGIALGREDGFESLARLFEAPFHPGGRLRTDFLAEVGERVSFAKAPLYAAIHESIYGGAAAGATAWAAQRVSEGLGGFAPDASPDDGEFYLTGEHIFPFQFAEDPALRPFERTAHELAEKDDWGDPYAGLGRVEGAYAVVYTDDIYVPRELSLDTARRIGAEVFETSKYQHDGLRRHGGEVLGRLLDMAFGPAGGN